MKLHLRDKLLIVFIFVALVPLAVLAGLGVYFMDSAQRNSVAQLEAQLLAQKEKEIDKFTADVDTLFHVQVTTGVAALSGIEPSQRAFLLEEIAKANRSISEVSFLEYDASYPDKPGTGMELNKMSAGQASSDLADRKDTPAFKRVIAGGDYFGPVYQKGDDSFMTVAAPVKNKDGVIIGAISGEISLKPVERIVNDGVLGNTGYLMLADEKGALWVKPPQLSFKGFNSHVYAQSVLGGEKGIVHLQTDEYVSSFGELVVASGIKTRNLGWVLLAEWPKNDAYEVINTIIGQAALFFLIILGMVVVASFLFAYRIIKPVRTLEEGTRIIGGGNLDHRIVISTRDEFEILADRFNEMAKNLKGIQELREIKARVRGLAQSLQKEKELSQVKDQFIATASHQLRTPVSVIRWTAEGLQAGLGAGKLEDAQAQLKDLSQNVEALALVIGDILTVAELGIGYTPKTVSEFSLRDKVREAVERFASEAEAKKLTISVNTDDKDYRVKASAINISRALEHLIANAIVYTKEKGNVLIELSASEKEVACSIKDDGIGVPAEDQRFLFGEFFRAKNSIEMKNVGTGLGLFIVRTIIEGHGGKVGVESPADWNGKKIGSRFYFTLPLQQPVR